MYQIKTVYSLEYLNVFIFQFLHIPLNYIILNFPLPEFEPKNGL